MQTSKRAFDPNDISQWFWDIIDQAQQDRNRLRDLLMTMGREEIRRFDHDFRKASIQLTDQEFTRYMEKDTSEDGARDIAYWVVSQGKAYYTRVWNNPKLTPKQYGGWRTDISPVASEVYWQRFHRVITVDED